MIQPVKFSELEPLPSIDGDEIMPIAKEGENYFITPDLINADLKEYVDDGLATKANQSALDALTTVVGTKASQSSLDALSSVVDTKANQSAVDAVVNAMTLKQARNWPSIGPSGSGATFECNGTNDAEQYQAIADHCVAQGYLGFEILDGHYFFDQIVKIRTTPFYIVGRNFPTVTISPTETFGVSKTDITADAFFTFYDYNILTDIALSDIRLMNIVFDWMGRTPDSSLRSPSAIRYRPVKGNSTTDKVTTTAITSNTKVVTVPNGYDVLYGYLENTTANPMRVGLTTVQPEISTTGLSLGSVPATSFNNVSSNQLSPTGTMPAGSSLTPPTIITTSDTYLGLISAYFMLTSLVLTNNTGTTTKFKLQTKPASVNTNDPSDYTDLTGELTIPANGSYTITGTDISGTQLPSSVDQLVRINQASSTWSGVKITVGAKVITPTRPTNITVSGTSLGVILQDWDITKMVFANNTASDTNFKLQVRSYAASGRDSTYTTDRNWVAITGELTIPANGSLTVKRSDFIAALPTNSNTDIRIVQGAVAWSGVDVTLTSVEQIHAIYDFYREIVVPGEQTVSQSGFTTDAVFNTPLPADYYIKSITFTETAGHDWSGYITDDSIAPLDRVFVPANSSVTVDVYGNSAKANPVISGGSITSATITNGGTNYSAAPLVQIQGDGTGATATATVGPNGNVTGITITNGGTGYTQATITLVSIQRYNYVNPLPYTQTMKVRAQQPPAGALPYAKTWNDASINVSITLGVRIGIRKQYMNRIFPQSSSRDIYVVSSDNDFNSASLKTTFQIGKVTKNFQLENIKIVGFPATGFGAIEVLAGKVLGSSNLSIGQAEGMLFKNLTFENSYFPAQNSTTRMMQMHFTSTFVRDIIFDNVRFEDTHGSSIMWSGDSGDSLPIIVVRARQNILAKDLVFMRTKKGVFNGGTRLEDWGDETRIGFHHLHFVRPVIEEGTDGWFSDFGYETEGAADPWSIITNSQTRSGLNFMNSRDVVIDQPRFVRVRTPLDYGYTNPPGNESRSVQVNDIYAEDCYELGDLDGTQPIVYNGGQIIRLRVTGKINSYGNHNPTIWQGVYFEDPGIQIQPALVDRCLFQVHDGGNKFLRCVINLTTAQNIDYIFQEQNSNASANMPICYIGNTFMGVAPNIRTFGLNVQQYHVLVGNIGVSESTIQAVFTSTRTPITPQSYLGVGYGNIRNDNTVIDQLPDADKMTLSTAQTATATKTFTRSGTTAEIVIDANTSQIGQLRLRKNATDDWFIRSTSGQDFVIGDAVGPFNAFVLYKATHMAEFGQGLHLKKISDMTGTPNGAYFFVDANGNPKWKLSNSTPAAKFVTFITTGITADRSLTLPNASTALIGNDTTDTLTNKSMSGANNTFSNIPESAVTNLTTDLAAKLTAINNLSDLASTTTARTNLGVYSTSQVDSAVAAAAATIHAGSELLDAFRKQPFLYCDFMVASGTSQMDPFTATLISSGTINTPSINALPAHPGISRLRSSTSADSGVYIGTNAQQILLGGGEQCEFVFRLETLAGTTTRLGFHDTATIAAPTDGAYVEIDSSGIATGKTANNGSISSTGTTITLSTATWYRAKVVVNSTSLVTFYIYDDSGTQLWSNTLTTNIPTAAGRSTGMGIITTNSGTSIADLVNLDYMALTYGTNRTR